MSLKKPNHPHTEKLSELELVHIVTFLETPSNKEALGRSVHSSCSVHRCPLHSLYLIPHKQSLLHKHALLIYFYTHSNHVMWQRLLQNKRFI